VGDKGRSRPVAWASLAIVILAGGVAWFVVGLWRLSRDLPIVTSSSFAACGQTYELRSGYVAFDYGSRGNDEVPENSTIFKVRSVEPDVAPPADVADIFGVLPTEISDLVVDGLYREWLGSLEVRLQRIEYPDGCDVSVTLERTTSPALPRSGEWAISVYETRPLPADGE